MVWIYFLLARVFCWAGSLCGRIIFLAFGGKKIPSTHRGGRPALFSVILVMAPSLHGCWLVWQMDEQIHPPHVCLGSRPLFPLDRYCLHSTKSHGCAWAAGQIGWEQRPVTSQHHHQQQHLLGGKDQQSHLVCKDM